MATTTELIAGFTDYVSRATFPCVGAKSALNRRRMEFEVCGELGTAESAEKIVEALKAFSERPRSAAAPSTGVSP